MSPRPIELPESDSTAAARAARAGPVRRGAWQPWRSACATADAREATSRRGAPTRWPRSPRWPRPRRPRRRRARARGARSRCGRAIADLHYRRACVLLRGQRRAEARRALDAALAINPRYLAARVELALLDAREGLVGEALESLRALSRIGAGRRSARVPAGPAEPRARRLGRGRRAAPPRAAPRTTPRSSSELRRVRELVEAGDRRARPRLLMRSLLPRFDAYPDLHALLGPGRARRWVTSTTRCSRWRARSSCNPDFHDARVLLARALEGLGQTVQAPEQIALVLEHEPEHARRSSASALGRRGTRACARGARRDRALGRSSGLVAATGTPRPPRRDSARPTVAA